MTIAPFRVLRRRFHQHQGHWSRRYNGAAPLEGGVGLGL
jgi:hypothetical protein